MSIKIITPDRFCKACGQLLPHCKPSRLADGKGKFCDLKCLRASQNEVDRFWSFVDKSPNQGPRGECWTWTGSKSKDGYGRFDPTNAVTINAHRYAWKLDKGAIPDQLYVLHKCDNRPCIRVETCLFLGNYWDNMQDMVAKGRKFRKIPTGDIPEILRRYASGEASQHALALEYGACQGAISRIVRGKRKANEALLYKDHKTT